MSDPSASPVRILIVDDEKDITTVLQMLLDDSGYKTDGFELSNKLLNADPAIKICFMTAFDWHTLPSSQRISESIIAADRYFRKPFSAMHLLTSIRDLLGGESAD